jgi:hypothetical protein
MIGGQPRPTSCASCKFPWTRRRHLLGCRRCRRSHLHRRHRRNLRHRHDPPEPSTPFPERRGQPRRRRRRPPPPHPGAASDARSRASSVAPEPPRPVRRSPRLSGHRPRWRRLRPGAGSNREQRERQHIAWWTCGCGESGGAELERLAAYTAPPAARRCSKSSSGTAARPTSAPCATASRSRSAPRRKTEPAASLPGYDPESTT